MKGHANRGRVEDEKKVLAIAAMMGMLPIGAIAQDWNGFYGELQSGYAFGDHSFSYENYDYNFTHEIYSFDIDGQINAATIGYRHDLFDTRWHAGLELSVLQGDVTGSKPFGNQWLNGSVTFSSEMVVSASILVGYALGEKTLVYGQLGKAAADLALSGNISERAGSLDFGGGTKGWVLGDFAAIGVSHKIRDSNWYWNAEIQYYDFNGKEDLEYKGHNLGRLNAADEHLAVAVGIGIQF